MMQAITVTREYGAGGYEVASRLAGLLGWELLDRELLHQAAALEHLPDEELQRLDEKAVGLADRFRLHPPHERYIHGLTGAAQQAAARGGVVLVGRGTGQLLAGVPGVFHLRLVAPREWRARRLAQREGWTLEQALARCHREDHSRDRFNRYFFGEAPFQPASYHAIFNTERVAPGDAADCLAALIRAGGNGGDEVACPRGAKRVVTLSRELGAGEGSFAESLAARLGLQVFDRGLLEREAVRLGVSEDELAQVDEAPAGLFQRFRPSSLPRRYFEAMGQLMRELAQREGAALLVGRGGSRFLRDHPGALHVRLVAPLEVRIRRVMEHRWVREEYARRLIAESDAKRKRFHESYFSGAGWADPLEYHLTVNTGLLPEPSAVALVARVFAQQQGEKEGVP